MKSQRPVAPGAVELVMEDGHTARLIRPLQTRAGRPSSHYAFITNVECQQASLKIEINSSPCACWALIAAPSTPVSEWSN